MLVINFYKESFLDRMETSENPKEKKSAFDKIKKIIWFFIRISIGAGIIFWLISTQKQDLIEVFSKIKYKWIVFASILYCSHLMFGSWRWLVLLKIQKIKLSFFETLSLLMQGMFFSLVIPGGAIGGDLVKAGILASRSPRGSRLEGTLTILFDRMVGMIALFSLTIFVALISIDHIMKLKGLVFFIAVAIIAACLAGLGSTVVLYYHRQLEKISLFSRLIGLGDKYSGGMLSRISNALDLYRDSWKTVVIWIIISVLFIHLNLIIIIFFIVKGLGVDIISFRNIVFGSVFGLVASLIPITPSGVGVRDMVMNEIFSLGGIEKGTALAIPLIFTSFVLIFNLLGGLFFIFQPADKIKHKYQNEDQIDIENH